LLDPQSIALSPQSLSAFASLLTPVLDKRLDEQLVQVPLARVAEDVEADGDGFLTVAGLGARSAPRRRFQIGALKPSSPLTTPLLHPGAINLQR